MSDNLVDLPQKTLFRPDEAARFFDVSIPTIYRWLEEGLLEGIKITNGTVRIKRKSIINLIK